MKFPLVNSLPAVDGHLTPSHIFLSSKDSAFFALRFPLFYYNVWRNVLSWFTSPNLSHKRLLSLPLLKFLRLMSKWSTGLIHGVIEELWYPLYRLIYIYIYMILCICILQLLFILPFLLLVFFSCLSLCFSFFSHIHEVDILYFVTGWAYASRHTILLGIGTATSIWCQSKYYSLFTDIMSSGHNVAHNEACLYIYMVQYVMEQCHIGYAPISVHLFFFFYSL